MSCKITFESNIKFREYDLLLILHTSSINVEFYSLSNTFYFIILSYIEQKIYMFLWRPAISTYKRPKKSGQQGSTRHFKVRTLKVNVSKSTAIIFARAGWCFVQARLVTLFREPIQWVDTTHILGVTPDKRLTWSPHIDQVSKKTAQRWVCSVPP